MTKPDDIPQDVWDKAILYSGVYTEPAGDTLSELRYDFARAIIAAKAEEREANEAACLERAETHKAAVAQYPDDEQSRILCLDSALEAMECAAAIRNRGEAD